VLQQITDLHETDLTYQQDEVTTAPVFHLEDEVSRHEFP
jgi:hypothetical protein